jgi:8-oxo-dGTP pyrophosphatase MutT (NUDIX family)
MAINNEPDIHTNIICSNVFIRKDGKYLVLRRSPLKKWLPNIIHPIGGKVDLGENPFAAAEREVSEEAGIKVKNMKLEAVILEIAPVINDPTNWLIFHFSADYDSGEIKKTEEGTLEWHTAEEIKSEKLFPSLREVIDQILDPNDGTVFATVGYDDEKQKIVNKTINICRI